MTKKKKTESFTPLSEGEMELLDLLWKRGPSTLTAVHKNYSRPVGYTTIQARLNRMVDKGVLSRSADYPALYEAIVEIEGFREGHVRLYRDSAVGSLTVRYGIDYAIDGWNAELGYGTVTFENGKSYVDIPINIIAEDRFESQTVSHRATVGQFAEAGHDVVSIWVSVPSLHLWGRAIRFSPSNPKSTF